MKTLSQLQKEFDETAVAVEPKPDTDPHPFIGRRIKIRWKQNKWFSGKIVKYSKSDNKHALQYDHMNKGTREYNLCKRTYKFI